MHSLISTSNYSATAYLRNSQLTTAPAKPFPACCITNRSPATASNSRDSSALRDQVLSSRLPYRTDSVAPIVFLLTPRHIPNGNTSFPTVPLLLRVDSLLQERVY
jgi:hypothetical protein